MQLKADFVADWTAELKRIMEQDWSMDLRRTPDKDICVLFHHAGKRRIEPRPRQVVLANTFECPQELNPGWTVLRNKIEAGADLSPHLSLQIEKVMATDRLLLDWGVYHLHLGLAGHHKNTNFVERTGPVVFGYPTQDTFHAIGVYAHGAWSDSSVIETLHANWPELTGSAKIRGEFTLAQQYTDDDRKKLRASGINVITALSDGTFLFPLGGGYAGNGVSIEGVTASDRERKKIESLERKLLELAPVIEEALTESGYVVASEVTARLNFTRDRTWVSFDGYPAQLDVT
ncbi:hypothetical protein [Pseudomonas putida]|uniref:hypothetical protein n=1 Tax=Pseudomonas putida TaxID=303 RepID=UPI001E551158|nr:hypothetical protein [Pseudomonas putida]MCE0881290.1 hypothetical protein [Pseudomonas putida]